MEVDDVYKNLAKSRDDCAPLLAPEMVEEVDSMVMEMHEWGERKKYEEMRKKALEILRRLNVLTKRVEQQKRHIKERISIEKETAERALYAAEMQEASKFASKLMDEAKDLYHEAKIHMMESECLWMTSSNLFRACTRKAEEAILSAIKRKKKLFKEEEATQHRTQKKKESMAKKVIQWWKVSRGESLWIISSKKEVFGNPLLWPLIFWANRSQIKDPNLIYQDQQLKIPRHVKKEDVEKAIRTARSLNQ